MLPVECSGWKLHSGPWHCCDLCGSLVFVGGRGGCSLIFFAVASGCPGSASLAGLAGESRELWKWLQYCPLSCQVGCDRQGGVVFMINLPGVIAGGDALQKSVPVQGGGIMSLHCCHLLFAALGSSVPMCRGSSCLLGVCTLCSSMHYLCVYMQNRDAN